MSSPARYGATEAVARRGRTSPAAWRPASREVEQRLRVIDTAQHGNVVLHSGYEPFVGAGQQLNAWSIATELRPDEDSGRAELPCG
jgi:hypothetical protein